MHRKIDISVIIPIYNVENYIIECLTSVVNQTLTREVECILVDDCGTDDSMMKVDCFLENHSDEHLHFYVFRHECNRGLSAARNTGINESRGEYIYFLDSDDMLENDALENLWNLKEKYDDIDIVQGSFDASSALLRNFAVSLPEYISNKRFIKKTILDFDRFPVMAQNRLIKRQLIINNSLYFKEGVIHEDNYWTFFLAKHINNLAVCKRPTYYYRANPNGITGIINIKKERQSWRIIIPDLCNNIDVVEKGAQKTTILNLLHLVRKAEYFSHKEMKELSSVFAYKNSVFERLIVKLLTDMNQNSSIYYFLFNALKRIYRISNL